MSTGTNAIEGTRQPFPWKLWAAVATVVFSIYRGFTAPTIGDSIFGMVIAGLLFLSEARFVPQDAILYTRHFFKYGDKFARLFLFIIAVGGTALVVKESFGLSLIPDSIDFLVKRAGPPLILISISMYVASILSKYTFYVSDIKGDEQLRRFEVLYYLFVIVFCVSAFVLFMGLDYIDALVTSQQDRQPNPLAWHGALLHSFVCATLISLIWQICYGLCVFSRFYEWSFRERYLANIVNGGRIPEKPISSDVDAEDIATVAFDIISPAADRHDV